MKLLEPIEINGMKLKNRIGLAPLFNMPAGEEGEVTDLTVKWFEERAKGGAGFIMTGTLFAMPFPEEVKAPMLLMSKPHTRLLFGLGEDQYIPGFRRITDVMHSYDCKIGAQVGVGIFDPVAIFTGQGGAVIPSPAPFPSEKHSFQEPWVLGALEGPYSVQGIAKEALTVEKIELYTGYVAAAAARAKEAGFDCVEVHAGHASMAHSAFLSPYYNRRTDQYGGDWEGRVRFLGETIKAMRDAVGEDYPIVVRINSEEYCGEYGITVEDTCKHIVPALEKYGADCLDVTQGSLYQTGDYIFLPVYYRRGHTMEYTAAVKRSTKLPVIGVGKVYDMEMAEKFLQEGKADIIYMARQLCADPETPKKFFEGRPEDIRKCIGDVVWTDGAARCGRPCIINYDLIDDAIPLKSAEKPKKVMIVGGGVGGMEAARIAASRGHKVTLLEKDPELGGMVAALALNPLMGDFRNIIDYLTVQITKLKVDVRVCREVNEADVEELKPDVVILATGSSLAVPDVAKGKLGVMTHIEALKRKPEVGQKVVVWGFPGAEYAIALAEESKDVTLIGGAEKSLTSGLMFMRKFWVSRKLSDARYVREHPETQKLSNPKVLYKVKVKDITTEGIKISQDQYGERILPYDTLIVSRGRRSNDALYDNLKGKVAEIYKIGDCFRVKDIKEAIWKANEVARTI